MKRFFDPRVLGAMALLAASGELAIFGQPSPEQKWQFMSAELAPRLSGREVHIDPAELLHLMNDDYIDLLILDVRPERDWNIFRLVDSERVSIDRLEEYHERLHNLPGNAVVVVVSNDEILATEAWKRLIVMAKPNAYILEGGINHWLNVYGAGDGEAKEPGQAGLGQPDGSLRHRFRLALGDRHAASHPDEHGVSRREYSPKVKLLKKVSRAGGCG